MRLKFRRRGPDGDIVVPIGLWIANLLLCSVALLCVLGAVGLQLTSATSRFLARPATATSTPTPT